MNKLYWIAHTHNTPGGLASVSTESVTTDLDKAQALALNALKGWFNGFGCPGRDYTRGGIELRALDFSGDVDALTWEEFDELAAGGYDVLPFIPCFAFFTEEAQAGNFTGLSFRAKDSDCYDLDTMAKSVAVYGCPLTGNAAAVLDFDRFDPGFMYYTESPGDPARFLKITVVECLAVDVAPADLTADNTTAGLALKTYYMQV